MKKWITLVAVAASTAVAAQKIDRSERPAAGKAPIINIKNSEVFKLNNGLTVILSEDHRLPRASFQLVMGATPMVESDKSGLNKMMGELVMSGTDSRSKDELDREIDYMGATLNADGNSVYMSCLTKHLDKALTLMSDVAEHPSFPQSEFDRIKKQQESGLLSAKSNPDAMSDNVEKKVLFPNHPYGNVMSEKTLNNITRDDVVKDYKAIFTPDGAYLVIVGDITKAAATELANKYFGSWTGAKMYKADLAPATVQKGNRVIFVNKPGAVQSVVAISKRFDMKPGDKDQLPLTVENSILGGSAFGARLMQNLREDKAYTYGAYSGLQVTRNGSWVSAGGSFRNDVTDSAVTQLIYELDRISDSYVTPEELNLAKQAMAGSFARSLENPQTIARFALNIIQNNLPQDYYQTYLQRLDAISKDDVLSMSQKYVGKGYTIVVVGNEAVLEKLKQFDTDGVIEKMDAFGDPVIEMKPANITTSDLMQKYLYAVTETSTQKEMDKKLKKIKSVTKKTDLDMPQMGMKATLTEIYVAPNKEFTKMEGMGMTFMSSWYDGSKGANTNMQTGKKDMDAAELEEHKKTAGLFPELNYNKGGLNYEVKGIETMNGQDYYVVYSKEGDGEEYDYYSTTTFLKAKTVKITTEKGETQEQSITYDDYRDVNGLMFPYKVAIGFGEMNMDGTVSTVEINGKVDMEVFK